MKKIFITILSLSFSSLLFSQESMTLQQAIRIGLENNYSIKVAENLQSISTQNRKAGYSGLMPRIDATAGINENVNDTRQVPLLNGQIIERDDAKTTMQNAGLQLSWTIFDGFGMFATYDRLKELEKIGEINAKAMIQSTVADIMINYYAIVAAQEQLEASIDGLEVSKQRLNIAESKNQVGSGSTLDLLNARVDYNADVSLNLKQQENLKNLKYRLNELLVLPMTQDYVMTDSIPTTSGTISDELYTKVLSQNPNLLAAKSRQRIAELNIKEVSADRYPTLTVVSGYNYNNQNAQAGFFRENRTQGFNYGINANINVFNGLLQTRREKVAKIEAQSAELDYQLTQKNLEMNWNTINTSYSNNFQLVKLEEENQSVSKRNLEISMDKYTLGGISSFQLREAQKNFIDANSRYTDALYQYKLAEISLLELAGELIK